MTPNRSQRFEPNQEDTFLWGAIILAVVACAVWYFYHEKIAYWIMYLRYYEAILLGWIDPEGQAEIYRWLSAARPSDVTLRELWTSGLVAGHTLRWGVLAIVAGLFLYLLFRSPEFTGKYSKSYTMESLAQQEAAEWPYILPALTENLLDIPLDDPVHGMRQRGRDYGRRWGFVVHRHALTGSEDPSKVEDIDGKDVLLLDKAAEVFAKQLGRAWLGVNHLKEHERCLFAAFAAQIEYDNELAQEILKELAIGYVRARRQGDVRYVTSRKADLALSKYGSSNKVKRISSRHAYVRTVLMSMLQAARANGVLPACWFRWLKTIDRVTWYCLCDLGMDQSSVESAGVRAHWLAECMAKTTIVNPMIGPAIDGLKVYLKEFLDVEDDD